MRVSKQWLKNFINLDHLDAEELKKLLSLHIIEVDEMTPLIPNQSLVIGHVVTRNSHPNAGKLSVCDVNVGVKTIRIVCGASNVAAEQRVIVALPGTQLANGLVIKSTVIRDEPSEGMICSLKEIGFDEKWLTPEDQMGIHVLPKDAPIGMNALHYMQLEDTVYELGLTPNRGDLLSHLGVAYDLAAVLEQKVSLPEIGLEESKTPNPVKVVVQTEGTPRYSARYIKNVTVAPSPWWLKVKLLAAGIRPINNIVDITNFVMIDLGQPLHAFDAEKVSKHTIVVRQAKNNETVITLDEEKRILNDQDMVITDGEKIIAIAGIMGTFESGITNQTQNIILESANFNATYIRATAAKLNCRSDSSLRFERAADPDIVDIALERAAQLIAVVANGEISQGVSRYDGLKTPFHKIEITTSKVNHLLGTTLTAKQIEQYFQQLAFDVQNHNESLTLTIPRRRPDLVIPEDLIEEIARIHGYDRIKTTLNANKSIGGRTLRQRQIKQLRHAMAALGLNEVMTYSLQNAGEPDYRKEEQPPVRLMHPMSEERAVLRQSLIGGLIDVAAYNSARQEHDLALFEIGRKYQLNKETLMLCGLFSGVWQQTPWRGEKRTTDFFDVKGIIAHVLRSFGIQLTYQKVSDANTLFHPGQTSNLHHQGKVVGIIASLHPRLLEKKDLKETFVFELDLDAVLPNDAETTRFSPLPRHPYVHRDLAVVIHKDIDVQVIEDSVKALKLPLLKQITLFDLYEGKQVGEQEKSCAFTLTFGDRGKTLTTAQIDKAMTMITETLKKQLNAIIRN